MSRARRRPGALALVLHSHMPYVEGFGTWPFGEEWLWEAVACVYLPLLELLDGAPVTVGLTPVLCDQLEAMRGEAGERYLRFLREVRAAIHAEDAAGLERGGEPELAAEVRRAAADYSCGRGGLRAPRARPARAPSRRSTAVELWTSAATHALLPLLATDAGHAAPAGHRHGPRTGASAPGTAGFWLPECAYAPGLERELADHGVRAFCVDQTRRARASTSSRRWRPRPGPVAVPIDWATVELVWDDRDGYPASGAYRDYHRRTIHDLKPWNNAGGPTTARPRSPSRASTRATSSARAGGRACAHGGLLCCALDTELLGHWWYEGQAWLRGRARGGARRRAAARDGVGGARAGEPAASAPLAASSWGHGKDLSTWDAPAVAELAFAARAAELRTVAAVAAARRSARRARARRARAAGAPGERLGVHGHPRSRRRLPRGADAEPRRRPRRGPRRL